MQKNFTQHGLLSQANSSLVMKFKSGFSKVGFGTFPVRTHIMTNFPSLTMSSFFKFYFNLITVQQDATYSVYYISVYAPLSSPIRMWRVWVRRGGRIGSWWGNRGGKRPLGRPRRR